MTAPRSCTPLQVRLSQRNGGLTENAYLWMVMAVHASTCTPATHSVHMRPHPPATIIAMNGILTSCRNGQHLGIVKITFHIKCLSAAM